MRSGRDEFQPPSRKSSKARGWEVQGDHGEWVPVDSNTEALLRAAQARGEASTDVAVGSRYYTVFFRPHGEAERLNLQTKVRRMMRDRAALVPLESPEQAALVKSLVEMDFAEQHVRAELEATGGDVTKTLERLIGLSGASRGAAGGDAAPSRRSSRSEKAKPPSSPQKAQEAPGFSASVMRWAGGGGGADAEVAASPEQTGSGGRGAWQVHLQGRWAELEPHIQEVLTTAARKGETKVSFTSSHGHLYVADLVQMVQVNEQTGRKRPLRHKLPGQRSKAVPEAQSLAEQAPRQAYVPALRFQVFNERSGWKMMSNADLTAIDNSLRRGKKVFEREAYGSKYQVNMEELTWTNLNTGEVASMRALEDSLHKTIPTVAQAAPDSPLAEQQAFGSPAASISEPLGKHFESLAGSSKAQTLSQEDVTNRWLQKALRETNEPEQGKELLLAAAEQLFERMALGRPNLATRDEWIHYWMLEISSPSSHALGIIQDELAHVVREFPKAISKVLSLFIEADADFDGEIAADEMTQCCKKYVRSCWIAPSFQGANNWLRRVENHENHLEASAATLQHIQGSLNYFEFVGELVGRHKHEVWLHQYDISGGLASWAAPVALLQPVEGIWHTGIVVFGKEYWYGGQCFESKPEGTPFGVPVKSTKLGATLCTRTELWDKMNRELCREYTREAYDVLTHNCNHFSDEVAMFLLNKHIPDEVRLQPMQLANTLAVQALRPVLNNWLGGFDADTMKGMTEGRATDLAKEEAVWEEITVGSLVSYAREGLPSVTAEVLTKESGTCDLWWFEPCGSAIGAFIEAANVSKMQVSDLKRHTGRTQGRRVARISSAPTAFGGEATGCTVS